MAITKRSEKGSALTHDEMDGNFTHLEKNFVITASGSSAYVFDGSGTTSENNPTLYLTRGETYTFHIDATGHPFHIKTVSGTGTGNQYTDGVSNNGIDDGDIEFVVQMDAPETLYYNCENHAAMKGTIYIDKKSTTEAATVDDATALAIALG